MSKKDPRSCYHQWEDYVGIYNKFKYCNNCGIKHEDQAKIFDHKFLEEEFPHLFIEEEPKEEENNPEKKEDPAGDYYWRV